MRSLYWKIFISFWIATVLIILSTAWITSEIAKSSQAPAREFAFMDSYANAAVVTYESGQKNAMHKWLEKIGLSQHLTLYLLINNGDIVSNKNPPKLISEFARDFKTDTLDDGIIKTKNIIVSHEILSTSGKAYRLAALSQGPISHYFAISWAGLSLRLIIAVLISGIICYFLSHYLTKPLRLLTQAAKSIARGKLDTRVGTFKGHHNDEIAELSHEFDTMAIQLEKLVHAKARLLQDISHELRSPLARIQVAIELGRIKSKHNIDNELDRMTLECERLNNLIGEIFEFSRLESETKTLSLQPIQLEKLLNNLVKDANYEFNQGKSRIELTIAARPIIDGDEKLIYRAIENILRNALRYSPPSEMVHIQLSKSNKYAMITITDKGPGVPDNQLDKIFHPFYRVDTSREKSTGGYGLGLSIANQAIRLHKGKIKASNLPEGGLSVAIKLPLDFNKSK